MDMDAKLDCIDHHHHHGDLEDNGPFDEQQSDKAGDDKTKDGYLDSQIEVILNKVFDETSYEHQKESQLHLMSRSFDIIEREKKIKSFYEYFMKQKQSGINQNVSKNTLNFSQQIMQGVPEFSRDKL